MNGFRLALAIAFCTLSSSAWAAICGDEIPKHSCFRADEPIAACTAELRNKPASADIRLALCEALAMESQLDEAEVNITQGIARCSGRDCQRLKLALSYLEEKRAARDKADPREAERKQAADRQFCLTPFNNARSISACERLLLSMPKDEAIYGALVNKLLKMGDPSGALGYALQARNAIGNSELFSEIIGQANDERKAVVDDCLNDNSIEKCELAYLAGSDDEHIVQTRRGELYLADKEYDLANEFLSAALALKPSYTRARTANSTLQQTLNPSTKQVDPIVADSNTPSVSQPEQSPTLANTNTEPRENQVDRTIAVQSPTSFTNSISAQGTSL